MLMRLTSRMRMKAARILVALYAFCLAVPVAGFVLGDSALAHCLTPVVQVRQTRDAGQDHQAMHSGMTHDYAIHDHASHDHHASAGTAAATDDHAGTTHTGGKSTTPPCCVVMCVSALPASPFELAVQSVDHAPVLAVSDAGIAGEAPDSLYRPPIVLLSL